jgi:hypothetical protein
MEANGLLHVPNDLLLGGGNHPWYPLDMRLGGPKTGSGLCPCLEFNLIFPIIWPVVQLLCWLSHAGCLCTREHSLTFCTKNNDKKFCVERIGYFRLIRHEPLTKRRVQQFFYFSFYICCRCNNFTEPFRCNDRRIHKQTHGIEMGSDAMIYIHYMPSLWRLVQAFEGWLRGYVGTDSMEIASEYFYFFQNKKVC